MEARLPEVRLAEVRGAEVRHAEVCPAEVRFAEVRPAELRRAEVRRAEVRHAEVCPAEVRHAEVRPAEERPAEAWNNVRVLAPPSVPGVHVLLEQCDVIVVRHGSNLSATTLFWDGLTMRSIRLASHALLRAHRQRPR